MKKCKIMIFLMIGCILCTVSVAAHPASQENVLAEEIIEEYNNQYYIGGEMVGWSIDESFHLGNTSCGFRYSSQFPPALIPIVEAGAQKWLPYVTFGYSDSGMGVFTFYNNPRDPAMAAFTQYAADSMTGHLTTWTIKINISYTLTEETIAHELGHVIGLNDLYDLGNTNKLMYGVDNRTVTGPSESDLWGVKVITGAHIDHDWGNYGMVNYDNCHARYCNQCNGASASIQACVFQSFGSITRCTLCGRRTVTMN